MVLITSLAAGTDQLGAESFLSAEAADRQLEVILPFDRVKCSRLAVQDGGQPLDGFLQKARAVLELSDFVPKDLTDDQLAGDAEERRQRELRYVAAADILLRQADLLIAVWDGLPGRGPGGTAPTIALALREGLPVLRIDAETGTLTLLQRERRFGDIQKPDVDRQFVGREEARLAEIFDLILNGPLARHHAPAGHQASHGHGSLTEAERTKRYCGIAPHPGEAAPASSTSRAYERMLRLSGSRVMVPKLESHAVSPLAQRDQFLAIEQEAEVTTTPMSLHARWARPFIETDHIARSREAFVLPALPRIGTDFHATWAHADANATWLSHAYRSAYVSTFVIGSFAVFIGLLGLLGPKGYKPFFVGAEIVILSVAIWYFWQARHKDLHARYIDARHLAEQFRPGWALAQLGLAGRKVLSDSAPWTAWAAQIHIGSIGLPQDRLTPDRLRAIAANVSDQVVVDQVNYHRSNRARMLRLHDSLEAVGVMALFSAPVVGLGYVLAVSGKTMILGLPPLDLVLAAVVALGLQFVSEIPRIWRLGILALFGVGSSAIGLLMVGEYAPYVTSIAMAALPALAAAVAGIRYQGDFERFSKRSDRTARELARLGAALADFRACESPTYLELRDILLELERVLLSDIEDWRFVYAERPSPEP
ncbi:MAG: hypothetical protein K2X45_02140 [Phreatobacter sp.]|nr:hypothetical protein [Phreatobacter sp.]